MSDTKSTQEPAGFFASTEWSLALAVVRGSTAEAEQALAKLCGEYWAQINAYLRRKGYSVPESEDLTQSFFLRMLEKNFLQEANPERGRFRSFLLAALNHFLANEWDRARAQKRGGQHQIISLEEIAASEDRCPLDLQALNPEEQFERQWALTTLHRAITLLLNHKGSRNRASQPRPLARFSSVSIPPWPSAICRLSARPMPDPPGLVVKNGTKRFEVLGNPGPSSSTETSRKELFTRQVTSAPPPVSIDASTALRITLISNCSN